MLDSTLKEALSIDLATPKACAKTSNFLSDFEESRSMLKACIAAHVALARLSFSQQSMTSFAHCLPTLHLVDAVGAEQLAGEPVSIVEALTASPSTMRVALSRYCKILAMSNELLQHSSVNSALLSRVVHHFSNGKAALTSQQDMAAWQTFVQRDASDLDVLVMMAVAHYQLLSLKPYTQSNTQSVHVLDALLLVEEGVLPVAGLPLASYFSKYADSYKEALDGVRHRKEWEPWVLFFLKAVTTVAHDVANRVSDAQAHSLIMRERIEQLLPKQADAEAFAAVCLQPSCGIADVVNASIAGRQTAASYLHKLTEDGVLNQQRLGKEKRFINPFMLSLFSTVSYSG